MAIKHALINLQDEYFDLYTEFVILPNTKSLIIRPFDNLSCQ